MFEREELWQEYLDYLYRLAEKNYNDHPDVDSLVQDTLTAMIIKLSSGDDIEYPKGFLAAVIKNKYNTWLREKYRANIVEYSDATVNEEVDEFALLEENARKNEEYESVRREIGRLIRIYREVTVSHYVHGNSVDDIALKLGLPRGTVLSRLSAARKQIKEGIEGMEKYSRISFEPKKASIGIWGGAGLNGEPFSLLSSDIEANVLYLAYENPVSVRGIADTMGMPSAYLEPIIDRLVKGELMGRTAGGLVYTRCFVQNYEDSFGNIAAQEKLAKDRAEQVWKIVNKHFSPLFEREEFAVMSEKQKATALLHFTNKILGDIIVACRPESENVAKKPPERKNGGRWLATLNLFDGDIERHGRYDASGPLLVSYAKEGEKYYFCRMFDFQSVFGAAHWAYNNLKYKFSPQVVLRFYASFLEGGIRCDNNAMLELIPDFEKLGILKRKTDGTLVLDVPYMSFDELKKHWKPAYIKIRSELKELLFEDIKSLWEGRKNKVPKHVDEAAYFVNRGALGAFPIAMLLELVEQNLLPFPVSVGNNPIIFIEYRKEDK